MKLDRDINCPTKSMFELLCAFRLFGIYENSLILIGMGHGNHFVQLVWEHNL